VQKLTEVREARALTLRELEKLSGVAASTIKQIELGHRKARASTVRKLAGALGIDPEELTGEVPSHGGEAIASLLGMWRRNAHEFVERWEEEAAEWEERARTRPDDPIYTCKTAVGWFAEVNRTYLTLLRRTAREVIPFLDDLEGALSPRYLEAEREKLQNLKRRLIEAHDKAQASTEEMLERYSLLEFVDELDFDGDRERAMQKELELRRLSYREIVDSKAA